MFQYRGPTGAPVIVWRQSADNAPTATARRRKFGVVSGNGGAKYGYPLLDGTSVVAVTIATTTGNAAAGGVTATISSVSAAATTRRRRYGVVAGSGGYAVSYAAPATTASVDTTVSTTTGNAVAAGVTATITNSAVTTIATTPGNAVADGVTAKIIGTARIATTTGNAVADGVDCLIGDGTQTTGGGYDDKPKRKRYIVKVGDRLVEFKTHASVTRFLDSQEPDEPPKSAPKAAPVPRQASVKASVPIAEIKRLAPDTQALKTFDAQLQKMQFEAILQAYEQWQDDEDVEMLLMAL